MKKTLLITLVASTLSLISCNSGGQNATSGNNGISEPVPTNNPTTIPSVLPTSDPTVTPIFSPTPSPTNTPSILPVLKHLYIANERNSFTECNINESGLDENSCQTLTPSGSGTLSAPIGVAVDNNNHLLISNFSSNSITQCNLESGLSDINSCLTSTLTNNVSPEGMTIYNGNLYIANNYSSSDIALSCSLVPSGVNIGSCITIISNAVGGTIKAEDMAFDNYHVFFTNYPDGYIQCNLNSGNIDYNSCTQNILGTHANIMYPRGVSVNNGFIYFINSGNNSVTQCPVTFSGVDSSNCINLLDNNLFQTPIGISIDNNYAYISNMLNNSLTQCNINESGLLLNSCIIKIPTGSGALSQPWFTTIN